MTPKGCKDKVGFNDPRLSEASASGSTAVCTSYYDVHNILKSSRHSSFCIRIKLATPTDKTA